MDARMEAMAWKRLFYLRLPDPLGEVLEHSGPNGLETKTPSPWEDFSSIIYGIPSQPSRQMPWLQSAKAGNARILLKVAMPSRSGTAITESILRSTESGLKDEPIDYRYRPEPLVS